MHGMLLHEHFMQLKIWRKSKGLTQTELGSKVGLTGVQIGRIERGLSPTTRDSAKRIEVATGGEVTAAELLGLAIQATKRTNGMKEEPASFKGDTAVEISIPAGLLASAREYGLDVESLLAKGGVPALEDAGRKAFLEQNREAIEANRAHIETYGTFGQRYGVFRPR